jgi:SPP1 family predicted phage head-tail adaptor
VDDHFPRRKESVITMRAGSLRHRITIQEPIKTTDAHGGQSITWNGYHVCWAEIVPEDGSEKVVAEQSTSLTTHTVKIRYDSRVISEHRVLFGIKPLNIVSVINVDLKNRQLVLKCTEVV